MGGGELFQDGSKYTTRHPSPSRRRPPDAQCLTPHALHPRRTPKRQTPTAEGRRPKRQTPNAETPKRLTLRLTPRLTPHASRLTPHASRLMRYAFTPYALPRLHPALQERRRAAA
eukprot:4680053-Prymnesium_polylepis.1